MSAKRQHQPLGTAAASALSSLSVLPEQEGASADEKPVKPRYGGEALPEIPILREMPEVEPIVGISPEFVTSRQEQVDLRRRLQGMRYISCLTFAGNASAEELERVQAQLAGMEDILLIQMINTGLSGHLALVVANGYVDGNATAQVQFLGYSAGDTTDHCARLADRRQQAKQFVNVLSCPGRSEPLYETSGPAVVQSVKETPGGSLAGAHVGLRIASQIADHVLGHAACKLARCIAVVNL